MKCRDCAYCFEGWFESKPNAYVCIGVKNPFVIEDIDVECTEYPERRSKPKVKPKPLHVKVERIEIVKHGEWLINPDGYYPYCSECKEESRSGYMTKYCPECGAKMDKSRSCLWKNRKL